MGEPDDPSLSPSVKSKPFAFGLGRKHKDKPTSTLHGAQPSRTTSTSTNTITDKEKPTQLHNDPDLNTRGRQPNRDHVPDNSMLSTPPPAPPPPNTHPDGPSSPSMNPKPPMPTRMKNGSIRFINHTKNALTHSYINVLLVFVPIGIAAHLAHLSPEIVFAMNAVAIIPLAGLLAHATEAVAARLGDALGALLNVSFGNAVELILFIILLADDQIQVVQAALLGSILANLLLILGMAFLLGGLRYQEQVYNSTVTQMSACMLSLAVMSLLLPTAFHAAFSDNAIANKETLYVSRGTSVILLLVYILYLMFQLKSHRYMYASTPQHIIDEESHPGVLADILNSSSSDSSSSSSSSDSDSSDGSSNTAIKKVKRAMRRKRRKSNASSKDTPSAPSVLSSPSVENHKQYFEAQGRSNTENVSADPSALNPILSGDEADDDDHHGPIVRDFEAGSSSSLPHTKREKRKHKHRKHRKHNDKEIQDEKERPRSTPQATDAINAKVAFATEEQQNEMSPVPSRRQFIRPALPSLLSNNVFSNLQNTQALGQPTNPRIAAPRAPLRRARSMPEDIGRARSQPAMVNRFPLPGAPPGAVVAAAEETEEDHAPEMSRTAAVVMLLISTALVAVCADFLSEAIEPMVDKTNISEAFIGLIILPIVGNAAEHVTAVTVAMKNKMDLSIGIAVGSSIQIAIFITPFVVILGWIMHKDMTLYFNIFETVALFVTTFIINFLVLDGRSNYLEGSLLIAAYVIIALASFFYPDGCDASQIGGNEELCGAAAPHVKMMVKRMMGM